ncbi:TIGR02281 family clan AA aspartic protease [Maritimibacter alkaliphilus]|uniref:retropepsin-like aspartic protease family protein n=1 Tax=Maritimibacter alkaliphilus TaxID=404236 RepID=UPI001C942161|nr:TIGR02281 family clan AA aspartic protease [Maritimibacter alkaliphilus]MBY6090008.1 TIGR02281 family clan AA aspartic protease [Maritimibacter alkaliphilus]
MPQTLEPRFYYLVVLLIALLGWMLLHRRGQFRAMLKQMAAWLLIFVAVVAGIGLWQDIQSSWTPQQSVLQRGAVIQVPRSRDGHYYMTLSINDTPVNFLVDTGASEMVLTQKDATRIGIRPSDLIYSSTAVTANGQIRIAPVRLDEVALGPSIVDRGFEAWVNDSETRHSLLGMSYLQRFSTIEIRDGALTLTR